MTYIWNPWKGCHKCSEGCDHCFLYTNNAKRGVDTDKIVRYREFYRPLNTYPDGTLKLQPGLVHMCFATDFFLEEGDKYRNEVWQMIKERSDCTFMFMTKRIDRFWQCVHPVTWGKGIDNIIAYVSVENQKCADSRIQDFLKTPIKHKRIMAQPLLERIDIEKYLDSIEMVEVGGELDKNGRPLDYDWVLDLRSQCVRKGVKFKFRQCATHFIKDGKRYRIHEKDIFTQARRANIDFDPHDENF